MTEREIGQSMRGVSVARERYRPRLSVKEGFLRVLTRRVPSAVSKA